jgi:hypothetical protein
MKVEQIYALTNQAFKEALGTTEVLQEDLSNLVDMGSSLFDVGKVDNYVKSLINQVGRIYFDDRVYKGRGTSVLRDAWEFGSVLEKIHVETPIANENESWDLVDGTSYDPNVFYKPVATAKFYNKKVTFEIPISITDMQVKESFQSSEQLNRFLTSILNAVDKAMSVRIERLIMSTINNLIGEVLYNEFNTGKYGNGSGVRAINLLYLYNQETGNTLKASDALKDKEFYRYCAKAIGLIEDRMGSLSTLYNSSGYERFTPKDMLHVMLLTDFVKGSEVYLEADTFHNEFVSLPKGETVPYWQGSGTKYDFDSISKIHVKTASGNEVEATGVLGVLFDHDAVMVCNENRRTTSNYNAKAEFTNYFNKSDCSYFNDLNENAVVLYIADPTA